MLAVKYRTCHASAIWVLGRSKGQLELRFEPTDLAEVWAAAMEAARPLAAERSHRLELLVADDKAAEPSHDEAHGAEERRAPWMMRRHGAEPCLQATPRTEIERINTDLSI